MILEDIIQRDQQYMNARSWQIMIRNILNNSFPKLNYNEIYTFQNKL